MANQRISAIYRNIPALAMKYHPGALAATMALRFGSFFISWLLGCFALAGIATVVNNLDGEDADSVWKHDSHQRAREHFRALVLAALFMFCAFGAGMAGAGFVALAAGRIVGRSHFARFSYAASVVSVVVVASVVSWFGMAIPITLRGNIKVWAALKRSVELSNGYEDALFWLVVQSGAGSYLAWYAAYYGFSLFFPAPLRYTVWYGWLVFVVAVLASAAVEPPLFIGFYLLAEPERLKALSFPGPQQSP